MGAPYDMNVGIEFGQVCESTVHVCHQFLSISYFPIFWGSFNTPFLSLQRTIPLRGGDKPTAWPDVRPIKTQLYTTKGVEVLWKGGPKLPKMVLHNLWMTP